MPPTHLHPRQAERFEVIEGAMHAIVDDEQRVFETGESFEVPARELGEKFFAEFHEEFRLTQPARLGALQHFSGPNTLRGDGRDTSQGGNLRAPR
jgi:Cupin domain